MGQAILRFLESLGVGVDSSGARLWVTSGLSHSWWFHSPLPCVHSPSLSFSQVTQNQPRRLGEDN